MRRSTPHRLSTATSPRPAHSDTRCRPPLSTASSTSEAVQSCRVANGAPSRGEITSMVRRLLKWRRHAAQARACRGARRMDMEAAIFPRTRKTWGGESGQFCP
eukprot:scaffold119345_cov72-Phaeocystis_antarctica.AAC.10